MKIFEKDQKLILATTEMNLGMMVSSEADWHTQIGRRVYK